MPGMGDASLQAMKRSDLSPIAESMRSSNLSEGSPVPPASAQRASIGGEGQLGKLFETGTTGTTNISNTSDRMIAASEGTVSPWQSYVQPIKEDVAPSATESGSANPRLRLLYTSTVIYNYIYIYIYILCMFRFYLFCFHSSECLLLHK